MVTRAGEAHGAAAETATERRGVRILAMCDDVADTLYGPNIRSKRGEVDLILTCGDLPTAYIDFVASMLDVPVYGIHGNHDQPPEPGSMHGCIGWLDGRVVYEQGLLIGGFDGSLRYNNGRYQFTETEMRLKVACMMPTLMANKVRYGRYLDILLTHAPPLGIHDQTNTTHRGFAAFRWFIEHFEPRYVLHGHVHRYNSRTPMRTRTGNTEVLNVFPYKALTVEAL
jgi:Icc-related predicted phosphoesterase